MQLATQIRDLLHAKNVSARQLKTLLIRSDQKGNCVWQLYCKDTAFDLITTKDAQGFAAQGGEVIYSDPRSPASRITKRLHAFGDTVLTDTVLGVPFHYATEGFFQVNIPVYEQALRDMREWIPEGAVVSSKQYGVWDTSNNKENPQSNSREEQATACNIGDTKRSARASSADYRETELSEDPGTSAKLGLRAGGIGNGREGAMNSEQKPVNILDLYSGVGSIGLTIGGDSPQLIEINEDAVREMKRNIKKLHSNATAVLAPSEKALDYITSDKLVIVDPPRAGLHKDVIDRLLETKPPRIIYLSCNPVTQARDVSLLLGTYHIAHHKGYNFFPRTPHIEHLVVLDATTQPQ